MFRNENQIGFSTIKMQVFQKKCYLECFNILYDPRQLLLRKLYETRHRNDIWSHLFSTFPA